MNDTFDDFWEYQEQVSNGLQEQVSNGLQEKNTIEDINIIEKHLRLVNHHFYDEININTENVSNEVRMKKI